MKSPLPANLSQLHNASVRPVQSVTREELARFCRRNRTFRQAWLDLAPGIRGRDVRGAKMWVFALGWLAGLAYFRRELENTQNMLYVAMQRDTERAQQELLARTGLGLLYTLPTGVAQTDGTDKLEESA